MNDFDPSLDEIVSAYVDGAATPDERARVEADPALVERAATFRRLHANASPPPPNRPSAESRRRTIDAHARRRRRRRSPTVHTFAHGVRPRSGSTARRRGRGHRHVLRSRRLAGGRRSDDDQSSDTATSAAAASTRTDAFAGAGTGATKRGRPCKLHRRRRGRTPPPQSAKPRPSSAPLPMRRRCARRWRPAGQRSCRKLTASSRRHEYGSCPDVTTDDRPVRRSTVRSCAPGRSPSSVTGTRADVIDDLTCTADVVGSHQSADNATHDGLRVGCAAMAELATSTDRDHRPRLAGAARRHRDPHRRAGPGQDDPARDHRRPRRGVRSRRAVDRHRRRLLVPHR